MIEEGIYTTDLGQPEAVDLTLGTGWTADKATVQRYGHFVELIVNNLDYSSGGSEVAFTLPVGYRPVATFTPIAQDQGPVENANPSHISYQVATNGEVSIDVTVDNVEIHEVWLTLDVWPS